MKRSLTCSLFVLAVTAASLTLTACQDATAPKETGSLAVEFVGLPAGVTADVRLSRGTVVRPLTDGSTVQGLETGDWTVSASPVTVNGLVYDPQPATQTVSVAARSIGSARVVWTPLTGSLSLTISGLPAGTDASLLVTAPGYSRTLTASQLLAGLTPGQYTIAARDVRGVGGTLRADVATQTVTVAASAVAVSLTVTYALAPAAVDVAVSGLPSGTAAVISLTAPSGSVTPLTASTRVSPAVAGRWRLTASVVQASGFTYAAPNAARDTTVSAGDTLRFPVVYALTTGAIAVAVTGLPQGATGSVTVTGPAGFSRALTATSTITDLAPGTYTVRADSVVRNGFAWRPAVASQQVTVSASITAAPATVDYSAVTGVLVVAVRGVPAGAVPSVRVTGPYAFDRTIASTTVVSPAASGAYTVAASAFVAGGLTYSASPSTVTRTVAIGGRDSVDVLYQAASGNLDVTVSGLPSGINASLTLSGGSQPVSITGTTSLSALAVGSYTLSAATVSSGSVSYAPTPTSQSVAITNGATTAAAVAYAAVASSQQDLILDQAYLTQATQTMDGAVALVAGRDALLRVFAHATQANTLTPVVRARIYDGASLIQTISIAGPAGGVPLAVTEGTLSSSWNVLIDAANIRPATRILVDIDPTNSVAEADESNNVWPSSGTPQSVTVNTVPTFTVRFVPVTVQGLTGNVTAGNMNSFLATARRVWPLANVVADVRSAPFSSSSDTLSLISTDANSKWLTVLSEMNTLRATDGASSTTHYYGVVKVSYTSGVAGYGYVPGRAAIGWDYLPSGDGVAAHEWGHNFSRPHAPCGTAGNPDPGFPYAGGVIGASGWNSSTNTLVAPTVTDLMGYCSPTWISDYNWTRVMTYRQSSGLEAQATGAKGDGLLVWGRVIDGVVQLEPAFRVDAPATAPVARPTHHVEAVDAVGTVLLDLPITAESVDHVTRHDERQFAVVVRWTPDLEQSLSRIRVRDVRSPLLSSARTSPTAVLAGRSRALRVTTPLAMPDPAADVLPAPAGRARLRWNSAAYPMAMVRDATSGLIMGYVRNSGDALLTGSRPLDVVFSDGVRSVTKRITPE